MKRSGPIQRKTPLKPSQARMKSRRSTGKPTKAEAQRLDAMSRCACLACRMNRQLGWGATLMELETHHLLSGGRRVGHMHTVRLCHYHHQGKRLPGAHTSYRAAAAIFGPSLEREPRRFREVYGMDADLLAIQNRMLREGA